MPGDDLLAAAEKMARRVAAAPSYTLVMAKRALRHAYEAMGFRNLQNSHRYMDTYLLDSHGDPRKDYLKQVRKEQGLKAFLDLRDGPYKDD